MSESDDIMPPREYFASLNAERLGDLTAQEIAVNTNGLDDDVYNGLAAEIDTMRKVAELRQHVTEKVTEGFDVLLDSVYGTVVHFYSGGLLIAVVTLQSTPRRAHQIVHTSWDWDNEPVITNYSHLKSLHEKIVKEAVGILRDSVSPDAIFEMEVISADESKLTPSLYEMSMRAKKQRIEARALEKSLRTEQRAKARQAKLRSELAAADQAVEASVAEVNAMTGGAGGSRA